MRKMLEDVIADEPGVYQALAALAAIHPWDAQHAIATLHATGCEAVLIAHAEREGDGDRMRQAVKAAYKAANLTQPAR